MEFRSDGSRNHRIIAYFDVDCFYAQDEVLRRPHLQHRPVGVTQKFLVVTCNYVARQRGVPKMAPIQEAKQRCPDLILFNGEDLTPYRASSKRIMAVLRRFGVLERRGLDEAALDITMEVIKRSTFSSSACQGFSGHVIGLKGSENGDDVVYTPLEHTDPCSSDYYLMVGSQVVAEIRAAVEGETRFRCSSGLATNKMLAKLVSSVNKPNKQTCILEHAVPDFLSPLAVRKLPGVGHRTESALKEMGISTVADLQQSTLQQLSSKLQQDIIRSLAPDLISRLDEDKEEHSRRPKLFVMKWRYAGKWAFRSCSAPMPLELLSASVLFEKRLETLVEVAMKLLSNALGRQSFALVVLNIGATSFSSSSSGDDGASHDIRSFLCNPVLSSSRQMMTMKVTSKREARAYREESEKARSVVKMVLPVSTSRLKDSTWEFQTCDLDAMQTEEEVTEADLDEGDAAMPSCCVAAPSEVTGGGLSLKESQPREGVGTCLQLDASCFGRCSASAERAVGDDRPKTMLTPGLALTESSWLSVNVPPHETRVVEHGRETSASLLQEGGFLEDESGLHGMVTTASHGYDTVICELCGQELNGDDAQAKQEHDDYHYAMDLELQEQRLEVASCIETRSSSTSIMGKNPKSVNKVGLHLKRKRALVKRSKSGSGTLDGFVYRFPG